MKKWVRTCAIGTAIGVVAAAALGSMACDEEKKERCAPGEVGCQCTIGETCVDCAVCEDGYCVETMVGDIDGDAGVEGDTTGTDDSTDDGACAFVCSDHCASIGGTPVDGACEDTNQKCCDFGADSDTVGACSYTCSNHCYSIGGTPMAGTCADPNQKCCDLGSNSE